MQFEEMKKIWDAQNNEPLYVLNEEALHRTVKSKKNLASRRINKVEMGITFINTVCAGILLIRALDTGQIWTYISAGIMAATVVYLQIFRRNRRKAERRFDRSIAGEIDHAIANTKSIIRFSYLMVVGYLLPIGIFQLVKMIHTEAGIDRWLLIFGAFGLAYLLIIWERKRHHLPRLRNLESLKETLLQEV